MPWDMQDYPDNLKNFDDVTKKKIIDIANAMEVDGYGEDDLWPIAISQGKKWVEDASNEEKADLETPKKSDEHESGGSNPDLMDNDVEVFYEDEEWVVKTVGADRASETFDLKADAVDRAQEIAANRDTKVITYTKDGKKQ